MTTTTYPPCAKRGEGDHPKHGGGAIPTVPHFPATALRAVPLRICDGEDAE